MKTYKAVYLNKGLTFSREKDLTKVDDAINKMVADGWALEHVVSPNDFGGAIIGIFSKEAEEA